jgi:hypothetical protein
LCAILDKKNIWDKHIWIQHDFKKKHGQKIKLGYMGYRGKKTAKIDMNST